MHLSLQLSLAFLVFSSILVNTNNAEETGISLTSSEVQALKKLRPLVLKHLYKDYMKEDVFLVRFLRSRDLNIEDTKESILQLLKWRKQNKIDTILDETLEIEKVFPYIISHDLDGRPVGHGRVGEWKIRRAIVTGHYDDFVRYIHKLFEVASDLVRQDALKSPNKNITQGDLVLDFSGFTIRENACIQCIPLYLELFGTYEKYYPQLIHKVYLVNVPRIFLSVWEVLKPGLSKYTRGSVYLYGFDSIEWRSALLKLIAEDQIPTYLGGKYLS